MERELLIPVKSRNYDKDKVENEIKVLKKILPFIESFETFYANNEIFDINTKQLIKASRLLKPLFDQGFEKNTRYYVCCKN